MSTKNPADYGTTVVKPADFDAFWAEILEEADRIPLNASMTPSPLRSTATVEVFEVHYDSLDQVRIAGWYCLPRERSTPLGLHPVANCAATVRSTPATPAY